MSHPLLRRAWRALVNRLSRHRPEPTAGQPAGQDDPQAYLSGIEARIRAERPDLPPPPVFNVTEIDAAIATRRYF